jgi:four helix bundle protein
MIFEKSKSFPTEERFSLTDQIRRSSRSIGAQIAEAWAKRRYEKHFVSKLTDGLGEEYETEHWAETACDAGYLSAAECTEWLALAEEIGRMLSSMIEKSEQFCLPSTTKVQDSVDELSDFISNDTVF